MDTAGKVAIGVSILAAAVTGVGVVMITRKSGLGRASRASASVPRPLAETEVATPEGKVVRTYHKKSLPIKERLAIIQGLIAKGTSGEDLPYLRGLALRITQHCEARDDTCEAKAIYDYVRENVRYTGDIAPHKLANGKVESVDLFQSARTTLEMGGGDCDDHAGVVATLAILNGIEARLRVTSPYFLGRDNYTHIYPVLGLPKGSPEKWISADTTLPGDNFGREVKFAKKLDVIA